MDYQGMDKTYPVIWEQTWRNLNIKGGDEMCYYVECMKDPEVRVSVMDLVQCVSDRMIVKGTGKLWFQVQELETDQLFRYTMEEDEKFRDLACDEIALQEIEWINDHYWS